MRSQLCRWLKRLILGRFVGDNIEDSIEGASEFQQNHLLESDVKGSGKLGFTCEDVRKKHLSYNLDFDVYSEFINCHYSPIG